MITTFYPNLNTTSMKRNKNTSFQRKTPLYTHTNQSISFGDGGLTTIMYLARAAQGVHHTLGASKTLKLQKELNSVISNPNGHTTETLVATLKSLIKVDDRTPLMARLLTEPGCGISALRMRAANRDFLNHIPDHITNYRQVKKDFFQDIIEKGYDLTESIEESIFELGGIKTNYLDLAGLDDKHYSEFKKSIIEKCVYSPTYPEKIVQFNNSCGGRFQTDTNKAKDMIKHFLAQTIPALDPNIYGSFLKRIKPHLDMSDNWRYNEDELFEMDYLRNFMDKF